jgi:hypothetical protein
MSYIIFIRTDGGGGGGGQSTSSVVREYVVQAETEVIVS